MNQPESNVIQFPRQRVQPESKIPAPDEIIDNIDLIKEEKVDEISEVLANVLLEQLSLAGFPISYDPKYIKDMCFCLESFKALMYKYYDIDHSFHSFADACFNINDEGVSFTAPLFKLIKEEG